MARRDEKRIRLQRTGSRRARRWHPVHDDADGDGDTILRGVARSRRDLVLAAIAHADQPECARPPFARTRVHRLARGMDTKLRRPRIDVWRPTYVVCGDQPGW